MIRIRKALPEDSIKIIEYQINFAQETENLSLNKTELQKGVEFIFNNPTVGQYYVAVYDMKVVGFCLTLNEWSDWRNGRVIWVDTIYVDSEHRGMGVSKELIKKVKEVVAQSFEYKGVRLYINKDNIHAQRLFESLDMNANHYKLYEWLKKD
ncbi:MAG: GNAT family N-acetyltransferase [Bacteroidota bacterium]